MSSPHNPLVVSGCCYFLEGDGANLTVTRQDQVGDGPDEHIRVLDLITESWADDESSCRALLANMETVLQLARIVIDQRFPAQP